MARDGDLPCMAVCATPVKGGTDAVPMKFVGSPLESGCSYYASCQLAKHARRRHEEEGTNTIFSLVNCAWKYSAIAVRCADMLNLLGRSGT
jgi:hypothetical protein